MNQPRNVSLTQNKRKIDSEDKLVNYIKTMLGAGLITVDVSDEQIRLCIDDTFNKFVDWAYDSEQNMIFTINTNGVQDYYIDERIQTIQGISIADGLTTFGSGVGGGISLGGFGQIPINYIPFVNMEGQMSSLENAGGSNYSATGVAGGVAGGPATGGNPMEQLEISYGSMVQSQTITSMFGQSISFDFNSQNHILRIFEPILTPIAIEASIIYVPNPEHDDAYGHAWIKAYSLNKTKLIWGQNVGKYSQSLVGGASVNYDRIIQEAQEQLQQLEEDLLEKYSAPLGIYSA